MKIGWLLSGIEIVAGARIHGWNMHRYFISKNIDSNIVYCPKGYDKHLPLSIQEIDKILEQNFDVLVFQGLRDGKNIDYLIEQSKKSGSKIVYIDTDNVPIEHASKFDAVITVSEYIKSLFDKKFQKNVHVIFDGYEHDNKLVKHHTSKKKITLVFVTNNVYDKFPQIEHLPADVSLKIIGPPKKRVEKYTPNKKMFTDTKYAFEYIIWNIKSVEKEILSCDVAVIPFPKHHLDHEYLKKKSNNRLILFMSYGLPTIVSPAPAYLDLLKHAQDGFIAKTPSEWIKYIELLRDNPSLRKKIGSNALKKVKDKYSYKNQAEKYLKIFKSLTEPK